MKKALLVLISILFVSPVAAQADEWTTEMQEVKSSPSHSNDNLVKEGEKLVDLHSSHSSTRIADLEQRISFLERQNRLQEEQIRRLDRSIDDVKRRR